MRYLARGLACAQLTAHLVPVDTRHHDVEQHEVGQLFLDTAERSGSVQRHTQLVLVTERVDQDVDVVLHVVNDEDAAVREILHVVCNLETGSDPFTRFHM